MHSLKILGFLINFFDYILAFLMLKVFVPNIKIYNFRKILILLLTMNLLNVLLTKIFLVVLYVIKIYHVRKKKLSRLK